MSENPRSRPPTHIHRLYPYKHGASHVVLWAAPLQATSPAASAYSTTGNCGQPARHTKLPESTPSLQRRPSLNPPLWTISTEKPSLHTGSQVTPLVICHDGSRPARHGGEFALATCGGWHGAKQKATVHVPFWQIGSLPDLTWPTLQRRPQRPS